MTMEELSDMQHLLALKNGGKGTQAKEWKQPVEAGKAWEWISPSSF